MKRALLWMGFALTAGIIPARAQLIMPMTTQDIQQQNQSTIQNSTSAGERGMNEVQQGQIEQRLREQDLFRRTPGAGRGVERPEVEAVEPEPVTPPPAPPPKKN